MQDIAARVARVRIDEEVSMSRKHFAVSLLPLVAVAAFVSPAAAAHHSLGTVTACSTSGNFGCATAQVRQGRLGLEYRTKNGSWVDCAGDCKDTLRRATVDFWEDQRESAR
jgi:hypothetical protein